MTNKTLNEILNNINHNIYKDTQYAIYYINNDVDLININATNCIELNLMNFYDFYLIKGNNTEDIYVGIVFDMCDDLHILISEKYRGQKYLHKTLIPTILPFIEDYKDRNTQYLSFNDIKVKEYFINEFGFKECTNSEKVYISLVDMTSNHQIENISPYSISTEFKEDNEIKEALVKELDNAVLKLKIIKQKLKFQKHNNFYDEPDNHLSQICTNLRDEIKF
ncbi:hypothetical protein L5F64_00320 [Aliarcobacter butzleri]|uniref:hypothetical protein n=1 Tax=Aliarcobacter butzleri TaxID=28197 RepID=UPI001EDAE73D|nr:hypothetical protein [Aliarcobacter butzleri]MCG3711552.1 hypothetical protein [Aliarcobacter butzleri]MCG3714004.1 hypothetical protein [Aliarcobacter butzleri]